MDLLIWFEKFTAGSSPSRLLCTAIAIDANMGVDVLVNLFLFYFSNGI